MKKEKSQCTLQKYIKKNEITIVCQQIWQPKKMDNLLENYSLSKLSQEEIDQLNRPITRYEIEYVIKTLPTN